ncbi:hypothetical protein [Terriglobus sp. TAA 43]|uniref:hypothetical protein n=1 Tax=Terriglobus sp. TAA 43 TaxID=278961 RepID=UPI0012ED8777|nr:hypothetical protein [Terriglobus sp. TAA 43]
MRHFFSNFASGWPALGLLLIRFAAGMALIFDGRELQAADRSLFVFVLAALTIGNGAILIAGLLTRVAGFLAVAVSACELVFLHGTVCPAMLLAAMGAGIAIVGPGAFSIDAWLFGMRRIDIERLERPRN